MDNSRTAKTKSFIGKIFESKKLLPIAIIAITLFLVFILTNFGPRVDPIPLEEKLPSVEVVTVTPKTFTLPVYSRGNVSPEQEITLSSEVIGTVTRISKNFVNGGYFKKGDWLVRIDPSHHEIEVANAQSQFAGARLRLEKTKAQVKSGRGIELDVKRTTGLAQGKPQLEDAQASYYAARTALKNARKKLSGTIIKAPFDGRVLTKLVNVKEYLSTGKPIAKIYATDAAELRLPLTTTQYEFVNVPQANNGSEGALSLVRITDPQNRYHWEGEIIRSEGTVDPKNRLIYVVAKIKSPFSSDATQPERPPLVAGSFVEAVIQGKTFDNIIALPRQAIHNLNEVWVVSEEDRLQVKNVDILYSDRTETYISSGLSDGDRVILSPLNIVIDNMRVNVIESDYVNTEEFEPSPNNPGLDDESLLEEATVTDESSSEDELDAETETDSESNIEVIENVQAPEIPDTST